jgi:hypothetical protein
MKKTEISKCVFCGEPIYFDNKFKLLIRAGEITMSFGYGSRKDTERGIGHIHDDCSDILEKNFKNKLKWAFGNNPTPSF